MAASINADNGVVSGSAGLKSSADATGVLALQTNGTTAVTIDTSQNVGIGTSSPATYGQLAVVSSSTNATSLNSINTSTSGGSLLVLNSGNGTTSSQYNYISFINNQTTSQTWRFGNYGSNNLTWQNVTSSLAAMTLDANGALLVGQTSQSQTTVGFSAVQSGVVSSALAASTGAANSYHLYSTGAGAYRFYVSLAGTVFATSTTISGISDQRLKENIRDLDDGLDVVMALKPRKFDWKEGKGANIKNARGFIAQEFEQVLPDMIEEWLDPAPEGEEPYKAVNANLIPTLVKAIQELKAEFDAYKASHP